MALARSQSMPKLQARQAVDSRPSTSNGGSRPGTSSWPAMPGRPATSPGTLTRADSLAMMPAAVRLEFHRYSTPMKGPLGRTNIKQVSKHFQFRGYVEELQGRSITMEQLLQLKHFAVGNCYNWGISASVLDFYHLHEWIVRPATRELNSAMMEHLSDCKLLPNWFVSHYWGQHIEQFVGGLRQHLAVRGLSGRTGYWICAFANRHSEFHADVGATPTSSPLFSAIEAAHFRVLLVLDSSPDFPGPATVLSRSWCAFECA
ncbi:unnamed protein product, partial [Effrenium voratum]